jgi:hypothetical protein
LQGNFVFGPFRYKQGKVEVYANLGLGFIGAGPRGWAQVQINNENMIVNEPLYLSGILHELIHVSGSYGGYDDRLLAVAAHQAGLISGDLPDEKDVLANSTYWTGGLEHACVPLPGTGYRH